MYRENLKTIETRLYSAFTMAEILISLTIIGVIAAITLPSLRANINETTWNTQRKALYSRMSQAIAMLPSLNGYGIGATDAETNEKAALAFATDGLSKVLQINNVCAKNKLLDCNLPEQIKTMPQAKTDKQSKIDFPTTLYELNAYFDYSKLPPIAVSLGVPLIPDTYAAAVETKNGESIAIYYNPLCQYDMKEKNDHYIQTKVCANFVYDLNGKKGPNTVGKDIGFITALYSTDSVIVAPMPLTKDARLNNAAWVSQSVSAEVCRKQDENSRVPNIDELASMYVNMSLIGLTEVPNRYWSSSVISATTAWLLDFGFGSMKVYARGSSDANTLRCIKR